MSDYLKPYLKAAARNGSGFKSLLWTSPHTQAVRFEAFTRLCAFAGRSILDVGCGRADLLDYLIIRGKRPADYTGIEAIPALADAAEAKSKLPLPMRIVRADFVEQPARLFIGADVIAFSGSLNTLDDKMFRDTLRRAWDATAGCLVFNFLDSPTLAANAYLFWRRPAEVLALVRSFAGLSSRIESLSDYLPGDRTTAVWKPDAD